MLHGDKKNSEIASSGRLVLVAGGTGRVGRRIVERLQAYGFAVRAASRSTWPPFSWSDSSTWDAALEGVTDVCINPPPADDFSQEINAFAHMAIERGVRRIVLIGLSPVSKGGMGPGQIHQWLDENADDWAVLRLTLLMENFDAGQHQAPIRDEDAIYTAAEDGRVSFVSAVDVADCVVGLMNSPEPLNRDFILTGPEAITFDAVAAHISEAVGRKITHKRISVEEVAARWQNLGMNPELAHFMGIMDLKIIDGDEERVTDDVQQLTGRPATNFRTFAQASRTAWMKTSTEEPER